MYDLIEVDISKNLLIDLTKQCKDKNIPIAIIGGWASFFYVNQTYRRAFGKDYMGSRDIDICFKHDKEKEFLELIKEMGFMKNGYKFRWEKIYNRETKNFLTHFVADHELGQLNDTKTILALDMWEHSYVFDYQPSGKKKYVEDFFANLNWTVIEKNWTDVAK